MRKFYKNLNEEEIDPEDLNDFRKILAIKKGKIDPYYTFFEDSEGKDYSNIVEAKKDGLYFNFDDLEQYLKFFFPRTYEEGTDGEYDAINYDRMYYGMWNFYDEFTDRSYDDWTEGYVVQGFTHENMVLLKDLLNLASPGLIPHINYYKENENQPRRMSDKDSTIISDFLSSLKIDDEITDAYIDGQVAATKDECVEGIRNMYCDPFYDIGIENYSKYCFKTYKLDWGSAVLLFARFGTEDDKLLDLIFEQTDNNSRKHLPEYYEMQYNYWDQEKFNSVFGPKVNEILENKISDILENEEYNPKYLKAIEVITQLGGMGRWIHSRDKKFRIKINDVDPKTAKITYSITSSGGTWGYGAKTAKSNLRTLLDYLNQGHLFDPEDYRE